MQISPPSSTVRQEAADRLDGLAKPVGSLGRLEELAAWLCACRNSCPPGRLDRIRAVVLAGDHGVAASGVSAYPAEVTAAMVRAFVSGTAAASVLARQHRVDLQVYDLGVAAELDDLDVQVTRHRVRPARSIDVEDALTEEEAAAAFDAGVAIAEETLAGDTEMIIVGDLGIGNTTPAAALVAAALGLPGNAVAGRGTGIDEAGLRRKTAVIDAALDRVGDRAADPWQRLRCLGSADLVAGVALMITAARSGVPILLDGLISVAEAITADELAPGVINWCAAGHRSTEPAQQLVLQKYGLEPLLDLSMRVGEGSGALAAVPLIRSAASLIIEMALLQDL